MLKTIPELMSIIPEHEEIIEDQDSVLIFGFPGIGKTYAFEHQEELNLTLQDSDSSHFHWVYPEGDEEFKNPVLDEYGEKVPHPAWPSNYAQYIELTGREQVKKPDYIMISTHEIVMNTLANLKFESFTIIPDKSAKNYFLELYKKRGSNEAFIKMMSDNWEGFIDGTKKRAFLMGSHIVLVGPERKYRSLYDFLAADPKSLFAMEFDK